MAVVPRERTPRESPLVGQNAQDIQKSGYRDPPGVVAWFSTTLPWDSFMSLPANW